MISLTCTQCQAHLEMDDAFAGGVCRCQHCGTIQTVPSQLKRRAAQPAAAPAGHGNGAPASAPVGRTPVAPAHPAAVGFRGAATSSHAPAAAEESGLDALAEALRRNGSHGGNGAAAAPTPVAQVEYAHPPRQQSSRNLILLLAAGGALLVALLLGAFLFLGTTRTVVVPVPGGGGTPGVQNGPSGQRGGSPGTGGGGGNLAVVSPDGPHFCGISFAGDPSVVYVLDRGQATGALFDTLKEATYRSLETLRPGQKFAIIFWDRPGEERVQYPAEGLADATKENIIEAQKRFVDVYANNRANAPEALQRAAALRPGAIVLVTGKAFDLEEELVTIAKDAVAGSGTQIHTVALHGDDDTAVLQRIAEETKGEFKVVPGPELRQYSY